MAVLLVLTVLFMSMAGHSSATWCICKQGDNKSLQKTLDFACGAGADCRPTHQNEPCFNPNTVRDHCNYAVNSYFQRNRQAPTACDFSGTATIVTTDPSTSGCVYPSSASAATSGSNSSSPGFNPNGALGGNNNGFGPTGITDTSHARTQFLTSIFLMSSMIVALSAHLLL